MRKTLTLAALALVLAACGRDVSAPQTDEEFAFAEDAFGTVQYGMTDAHPGRALPEIARLKLLPDSIRLTAEQEAEISLLLETFQTAHAADLQQLTTLLEAARAARQAGAPRAEVAAILADARILHLRLRAAQLQLRADILELLTPAQRTWLMRVAFRCHPAAAPPLSAAQKQQIRALYQAFRQDNQADLEAVRQAVLAARQARQDGASREEIRAILDPVRPAMERLRIAGDALREAINAVLTPAQRAAGCLRPNH